MVRFIDENHFAKSEHIESFFSNKETDCVLYSEEGIEFNIHKEIFGQTDFLRNILSSSKDDCCKGIQVFCPCSKMELDHMVNFLYSGSISCKSEMELFRILDNLSQIFGFPKEGFLPDNFADMAKEFKIKKEFSEDILKNEFEKSTTDTVDNFGTDCQQIQAIFQHFLRYIYFHASQ